MARTDKEWTVELAGGALAAEVHRVLEVSHRQAKGMLDAGCVKVNGEVVRNHGHRLQAGDRIAAAFEAGQAYQPLPMGLKRTENEDVRILWEDKHLVFVDKPAGLLTVPTETSDDRSLADELKDHYARLGQKRMTVYVVHRLDRHTSGVLVFAKTSEAMHALRKMFEEHDLKRTYRAVLVGELPENRGTLTDKLVERQKRLIMSVVKGREARRPEAKQAVTHYRVVERLPGHTVVELTLETGRRNQIRVQFSERGFPLLGDHVYGHASPLLDRHALHAEQLGFRHPVGGEMVMVNAPLPADLEAALLGLRAQRRVTRAEAGITGEEGIFQPEITREQKQERVQRALKFAGKSFGKATSDGPRRTAPTDRPPHRGAGDDRPAPRKPAAARDERPARKTYRSEGPDRPRPARERDGGTPARKPHRADGATPGADAPAGPRPYRKPAGKPDARPVRRPGPREEGEERPARKSYGNDEVRPRPAERPARKPHRADGATPGADAPAGPRPYRKPAGKPDARPVRRPGPREEGEERPARKSHGSDEGRPRPAKDTERPARKPARPGAPARASKPGPWAPPARKPGSGADSKKGPAGKGARPAPGGRVPKRPKSK